MNNVSKIFILVFISLGLGSCSWLDEDVDRFIKGEQWKLTFVSGLAPAVENVRPHVPIRHHTELTFGGAVPNPSAKRAGEQGAQFPIAVAEIVVEA